MPVDSGGIEDFNDEQLTCDPAGAIFDETLEDLASMDRELLLFSSGTNLAAVRWLFVLGADKSTRDSNGTTALHTACRTSTIPIIKELIAQGIPLDVTDSFGWTPMHIAVFMCRRDAVVCLLRAGAPLTPRNLKGQTPLDMCKDSWSREALQSFMQHQARSGAEPWHFEKEAEARQDFVAAGGLRYEPFFVPRSPVVNEQSIKHRQDCFALGQQIFNKGPGQGLAFLVASGATRDYPVDLSFFLRRAKLDHSQIGLFLGESFSLSQTLRLEFFNSVKFHGTSIVTGLTKVFTLLQIPPDLQKIDRLVHGVARIWWRQHDKLHEEKEDNGEYMSEQTQVDDASEQGEAELSSFKLKQYLVSPDTLYQLMFSVVMLHWNLYAPVTVENPEDGRISLERWIELNRGLEADGSDVPLPVLERTYRTVRRGFIPQLTIRAPSISRTPGHGKKSTPKGSVIRSLASLEGWAWIMGHGFGSMVMSGTTRGTQMLSIFSETQGALARPAHIIHGNGNPGQQQGSPRRGMPGAPYVPVATWDSRSGKEKVWFSLCNSLLFFSKSASPDEVPYAFLHLRELNLERLGSIDLQPSLLLSTADPEAKVGEGEAPAEPKVDDKKLLVVVFLLPDGRWQEFELPRLEFQVEDRVQLERWHEELRAVSGEAQLPGSMPRPLSPTSLRNLLNSRTAPPAAQTAPGEEGPKPSS